MREGNGVGFFLLRVLHVVDLCLGLGLRLLKCQDGGAR